MQAIDLFASSFITGSAIAGCNVVITAQCCGAAQSQPSLRHHGENRTYHQERGGRQNTST